MIESLRCRPAWMSLSLGLLIARSGAATTAPSEIDRLEPMLSLEAIAHVATDANHEATSELGENLDGLAGYDAEEQTRKSESLQPRASSPLDTWINPYGSALGELFWSRYDAWTSNLVGIAPVPTGVDWWSRELLAGRRFRFADPRRFVLLTRYTQSGPERFRPASLVWSTRFDPERFRLLPDLDWRISDLDWLASPNASQLTAIRPIAVPAMKQRKCPAWSKPKPVVVTSWGSDYDRLSLLDCDGNIAVDALDRVSALA
ncbi:MAG TPA: hypothetical protein VIV60_25010, partial [Polyangiaceae bacterium]